MKAKRTVRRLPLDAYSKSYLIERTKKMGVYKSKYNKAQLYEAYWNRLGEIIREVREKNKNEIHIIHNKKWSVRPRSSKRASRRFVDKGKAILYAIIRWNYKIVVHNEDAEVDFIIQERKLIIKPSFLKNKKTNL